MFALHYSLADWFEECRRSCEVDRLRWFLRDAEVFLQRTFGGKTMTTDSETKAVRDYLFSNPENLAIARTVHEAWPAIRDEICKKFLNQLRCRVESEVKEQLPRFANDIRVECSYVGERRWSNQLWLYRRSWTRYEIGKSELGGRTAVRLEADGKGPFGWRYGIRSPLVEENMTDNDRTRRQHIEAALKEELDVGRRSSWWPWWKWIDQQYRDWNHLVLDLHAECKKEGGGKVMDEFVNAIVGTAVKAIPIINKFEGGNA